MLEGVQKVVLAIAKTNSMPPTEKKLMKVTEVPLSQTMTSLELLESKPRNTLLPS